ncbi:MAG TPA: hypothetical protein VG754_05315 [Verrucomicrobiae bacterium]|nr:hypothetical protein [Verrucomicrobiae bacterium]
MKPFLALFFAVALSTLGRAENATVVESFENGIDNVSIVTNAGGRGALSPPGVSLSLHVKAGEGDASLTHGNKSLKVELSGKEKFGADFRINFSAEASEQIRKAVASPDIARYILRYDVIFPSMDDFAYFNSILYLGDCRDALIGASGKRSMSVALDLLTGLPESGPITLVMADDFAYRADSKLASSNVTLYIDNIRIVDTYAPGCKPVVYVLQSFEDTNDPIGGITNFSDWDNGTNTTRTRFKSYAASGPDDLRVTEGKNALEVENNAPLPWHADFTLPFNNTKLAEVLKLDAPTEQQPTAEELSHYTLRWDITYPDMTNEWMNSTFHTMETFMPVIQVRHEKPTNQRLTYSLTLDQVRWGKRNDIYPVLTFITEGPQKTHNIKIYYDNFRLIETHKSPKSDVAGREK